jgi:hypothetical protein
MNKKARDNRANQLNPNNPAYYKSRQGNHSKGKAKPQKKSAHQRTSINSTTIIINKINF